MPKRSRPRGPVQTLTIESLPLDSVRHFFDKPEPQHFYSLCSVLVTMADAGREDALTLLLGLAFRNRHDLGRMVRLVEAVRRLRHPEIPPFLASEFTRVPSTPQSRTYLTVVLEALCRFSTPEARQVLVELSKDPRVGTRYRAHMREYLSLRDTGRGSYLEELRGIGDDPELSGVDHDEVIYTASRTARRSP